MYLGGDVKGGGVTVSLRRQVFKLRDKGRASRPRLEERWARLVRNSE